MDEKITKMLAEGREHHRQHVSMNFPAPGICVSRCPEPWPCPPARAFAALEAAAAGHGSEGVYADAGSCGHPEPGDSAAYDRWDADHPYGEGDIGRICKLTEIGRYCPACTLLAFDEDFPVGDDYVAAAKCIVIPAIGAALAGEIPRPERCPRCYSPDPAKHPAMQLGGEVQPCPHPWHPPAAGKTGPRG